jgi:hypothetical protein
MKITSKYFEQILDFSFSEKSKKEIDQYSIQVEDLTDSEKTQYKQVIQDFLSKEFVVYAGAHRIEEWNSGWGENSLEFEKTRDLDCLIPKYFGKYDVIRLDGDFKKTKSVNAELYTLRVLQKYVYEKYCKNFKNYYEFGCGTGHNLLELDRLSDEAGIYGFDWSNPPERIFKNINEFFGKQFKFKKFDLTNPDNSVEFSESSVVFTFAALEQIGERNTNFINFLMDKKPSLCIHLEPMAELLDESEELQKLSIDYIKKRNYLSNFYNNIKLLEEQGKLEILEAKRTKVGSLFLEGYSLLVWRPR